MQATHEATSRCRSVAPSHRPFIDRLSAVALEDLESLEFPRSCEPGGILFTENARPEGVFVILSGEVKLSISSNDGRRLILSIVKAGEVLGLSSALSGLPCEMAAEVLYPAKIAVIERSKFLAFLGRHHEVFQVVTEELSLQYKVACEQLRMVALTTTAPEKLARLLLEWSERGQNTENGTRFGFALTHEEIGEFIGASRETVTRTLNKFKRRQLVSQKGSKLTIPNRRALESLYISKAIHRMSSDGP